MPASKSDRIAAQAPELDGKSRDRPAPRLGILGGGQLAKMTAAAAAPFGCEVFVLERQEDFPAQSLDTHALIGDWNDPRRVLELASHVDLVTLESEFVRLEALEELAAAGHRLWPSVATMRMVQDKLRQKETFAAAGLPLPRYLGVSEPRDVQVAAASLGWPLVLKRRYGSYDGKGNATVSSVEDVADAWERLVGGNGEGAIGDEPSRLYVEEWCSFVRELAIIVTRAEDGALARYPVVDTIQRDHICHTVTAPARVDRAVRERVEDIACRAVEAIGGVGSFGVELFLLDDGSVLVNEIAPRVHNTGHYTIEGCVTSQFENHVRAVLGWPLGSTELTRPAAAMINLLGVSDGPGAPHGLVEALAVEGAHIHVYGKSRSRRGRKMGHVTALGESVPEALSRAERAASCLRFGEIE